MAAKFSETSASLPPQRFQLPWFVYFSTAKMVSEVTENSPRLESSSPPQGAKPCRGLHQTLVTLFRHVVILAKQLRNSPPAPECCKRHTVRSQSVTLPPVLDCNGSLHSYFC